MMQDDEAEGAYLTSASPPGPSAAIVPLPKRVRKSESESECECECESEPECIPTRTIPRFRSIRITYAEAAALASVANEDEITQMMVLTTIPLHITLEK